jgi:hypothetical protein
VPTDWWGVPNGIHLLWSDVPKVQVQFERLFIRVKELLGKAIILLGERIMKQNLQNKIAISPWNLRLERAKLTLMMDGG